jgi:hypothetical protein
MVDKASVATAVGGTVPVSAVFSAHANVAEKHITTSHGSPKVAARATATLLFDGLECTGWQRVLRHFATADTPRRRVSRRVGSLGLTVRLR